VAAMMRSLSSCLEAMRIWRSTERASLEKKPSTRLSHEPCLGVKATNHVEKNESHAHDWFQGIEELARYVMTYCSRYRFMLLTPLQVNKGTPVDVAIPGLPSVTFEMGEEAYPVGHWAIAQIGGFATEEEASKVGRRLGDILLVVGAVTKLGIDVGFSRPSTVQFGEAVRAAIRKETGEELRGETHGFMVYEEEGAVAFMNFQARGSVQISAGAFEERLGNWAEPSSGLTERQRNCAALINDSLS